MVFSKFIWIMVLHIIAIVASAVMLGIFLQKPDFPYTISIFIVLLIAASVSLFIYLLKIRKDLLKLINALRHQDTTLQFAKDANDPYFSEIHKGFNDIIRNFRLIRLDKEAEHHFFKSTVDHIQFGMIAFDEEGNVEMVNRSFKELFHKATIPHVDSLSSVWKEFPGFLKDLTNHQEILKKVDINNRHHHLIFLTSRFVLNDKEMILVSVRDISKEIDMNELEAWQKLIRILKHEILNSISPIKLLSGNMVRTMIGDGEEISLEHLSSEEMDNMLTGLKTINRRATGLSNFVEAYSNLYQLPEPSMEIVDLHELISRVADLFNDQFKSEEIECSIYVEKSAKSIEMDARLIEQVLINLLKNGIDASRGQKERAIKISAESRKESLVISVRDNGEGIQPEQMESIFIPFYSSKEDGNGIGLSFAQHVMRLHGGRMNVSSKPGEGSVFEMEFTA